MGDKYLSDVMTAQDIIDVENNKICIFSGVGSGKNHFVEHELKKHGNILYISSRRAKVNEILEEKFAQEYIIWNNEKDDLVTTTNYGIEKLVKNEKFNTRTFTSKLSEIIEHFSFIVIDEAHSIATDATYATSSFHVFKFCQYVSENYPDIKIIFMTGTPEPLLEIPNFINDFYIFDKRGECKNIVPQTIKFIKKAEALDIISEMKPSEKTIYYTTSASSIVKGTNSLYNSLISRGIKSSEISICMSSDSIEKCKGSLSNLEIICQKTKESIAERRTLPDFSRILLTTSTLKEGVNIEDSSIKIAFCESHLLSDIQQFAGRVRTSLDTLYIIQNSMQHDINEQVFRANSLAYLYSYKQVKPAANRFLLYKIQTDSSLVYTKLGFDPSMIGSDLFTGGDYSLYSYGGEASRMFIDYIENKNQYILFNHTKTEFDLYITRYIEQKRVHKAIAYKNWKTDLDLYCKTYNIECEIPCDENEINIDAISEYLSRVSSVLLFDEERDQLKAFLSDAFHLRSSNPHTTTLNSKLKSVNLPFKIVSGNSTVNYAVKRYLKVMPINN